MSKILAKDVTVKNAWKPFSVSNKPDRLRSINTIEGVIDRLRLVSFAEIQAREAFLWAAKTFFETPTEWREQWKKIAADENRHSQLLMDRLFELGGKIEDRLVSTFIYTQCIKAMDPILFTFIISSSEERGMENGLLMSTQMAQVDQKSAEIFALIAEEEKTHIQISNAILAEYNPMHLRERAQVLQQSWNA